MGISMIAERCAKASCGTIAPLSHELAHTLLDSISHKCRNGTVVLRIDFGDAGSQEVRAWMTQQIPCLDDRIYLISLATREVVALVAREFVDKYDEIWYPGADDLVIVQGDVCIEMDHEEVFRVLR
jgi:hypothetical protein